MRTLSWEIATHSLTSGHDTAPKPEDAPGTVTHFQADLPPVGSVDTKAWPPVSTAMQRCTEGHETDKMPPVSAAKTAVCQRGLLGTAVVGGAPDAASAVVVTPAGGSAVVGVAPGAASAVVVTPAGGSAVVAGSAVVVDREGAVTGTVGDVAAAFGCGLEPQAARNEVQRTTAVATDDAIRPWAGRGAPNRPRRRERRRFEATTLASTATSASGGGSGI